MTALSLQENRGRGWMRCATVSWWRSIKISMSFAALDRASSASHRKVWHPSR